MTLEGVLVSLSGRIKREEDCESLEKRGVLSLLLNWDAK